ncbi:MAG: hypothetical protein FRX48_08275 [Lasallia pustulata]|uniref:Uncharacterized protein n=1 Tax=Lasallia pustulata TaxID=136370 RepID=A0A5M8PGF2_9LECA|nr:MAG: hypothetical protein FRX48_08275 [Lasallia pustulata]
MSAFVAINVPSAVLNRVSRGSSSDSPLAVNPVGSGAQCDKEGSGAESTGDVVVVAAATGKKKRAGVGRSLVGRPTKRVQGLFVGDTTNKTDSSPEWCRKDDLLPARVQQARRRGRVIWSHPDHTLLGDDCSGPCVRARVDECFVAQAPACARCTSLRNPHGQCGDQPPTIAAAGSGRPGGAASRPRTNVSLRGGGICPKELEAALIALSESVSNALRALNAYQSCRHQERSELLVQPGVEGMGSQAPPDSDDRFASAEED